jgi:translation initiation factor IF-1
MAGEKLEFEGIVEEFSNGKFVVKVSETHTVLATLSGKIRQAAIRIIAGDKVSVEVSPYDTGKGRITYRLKS